MKEVIFHLTDYESLALFVSYFVHLYQLSFYIVTVGNCWIFDSFECWSRPETLWTCMTKSYWWYLCIFICRVLESSSDIMDLYW